MILRILDLFWTNSVVGFSCYLHLRPSPPPSEVDSDPEFSDDDAERLGMDDHPSLCKLIGGLLLGDAGGKKIVSH